MTISDRASQSATDFVGRIIPGQLVHIKCDFHCIPRCYCHDGIVSYTSISERTKKKTAKVIHFCKPESGGRNEFRMRETSVDWFLRQGTCPWIETEPPLFRLQEVVLRAQMTLGEKGYGKWWKNCQHIANWCYFDVAYSPGVAKATCIVGVVGVIGVLAVAAFYERRSNLFPNKTYMTALGALARIELVESRAVIPYQPA